MSAVCSLVLWVLHFKLQIKSIASTWLLAALLSATIGLVQYFGYTDTFGGWVHPTRLGEAFANLRQRNQFATLTSIGLLALLFLKLRLIIYIGGGKAVEMGRVATLVGLLLLAVGNASSSSRMGMLQWCLIFAFTVLWAPRFVSKQVNLAAFAMAVYGLAVLLLPALLELWTGTSRGGLLARFAEESGCASRSILWSNVLNLIAQKPWLGWGWGELDYAHFITLYPGERFCDILDNAHNLPLHLAVELGVPAALSACLLFTWWVWRNAPWAETHPTRQMAWAVLAVIGLHSLLEYPLWYGPFQLAVGLCVLLLWRTPHVGAATNEEVEIAVQSNGRVPSQTVGLATNAVAVVCLIALAVAAWDYWRISQLYKLPADRTPAYKDNTLEKVRNSWFFQDQVQFAELTMAPLERSNAFQHYAQAQRLLHFSPEPRVIEAAIESAVMLGRDEDALFYLQRYKVAFPEAHAVWAAKSARFKTP